MSIRVLNPTNEVTASEIQLAPRLSTLQGKTVGFISNGKEGTSGFFAHLEKMLYEKHEVANVILRIKSNYSAPADKHIIDEVKMWDAAISGLGD